MSYSVTTLGSIAACCDECAGGRSSMAGLWDAIELLSPATWAARVVAQSAPSVDPLAVVTKAIEPEGWSEAAKPVLVAGGVVLVGASILMLRSLLRSG